jgi:hypothetical protein
MGYYHGMRVNSYLDKLEDESDQLCSDFNFSKKAGRQMYFQKQFADLNVKFLPVQSFVVQWSGTKKWKEL